MSNYKIFETLEFIERLSDFSIVEKRFLEKKIHEYVYPQLRIEPHYGQNIKKLVDYVPPTWRYRIGKFRIFYSLDEKKKVIAILTIELRKDSYK